MFIFLLGQIWYTHISIDPVYSKFVGYNLKVL
jgi:hypothetical protein